MNQTFNLNRFSKLFKKHTLENYRTYLMSTAVLAGILLLFLSLSSYGNGGYLSQRAQIGFFIPFLLGAGCIFSSLIFADLSNKKEAISALTLPASHFGKYLVSWLYSFVIFQLLFVAVFYLIAALVIQFGHPSTPSQTNTFLDIFSTERKAYYAFIIYPGLHAVIFFGAIYFEKLHFIKTAFTFFICAFLVGLLNRPILSMMFDNQVDGTSFFSPVSISDGKNAYSIHAVSMPDYLGAIVLGLVVLILWISAYYKLKEKEV